MTGDGERVPRLLRGVRVKWDGVRASHVLLGPERALMLDAIAHEILNRVNGQASTAAISADLARAFSAPREQVEGDVTAFLEDLAAKRLLEFGT